jgi:hypothetical protein
MLFIIRTSTGTYMGSIKTSGSTFCQCSGELFQAFCNAVNFQGLFLPLSSSCLYVQYTVQYGNWFIFRKDYIFFFLARTVLTLLTTAIALACRQVPFQGTVGWDFSTSFWGGGDIVWRVYPMRIGCMHLHTNLSWQMAYLKRWALTAKTADG